MLQNNKNSVTGCNRYYDKVFNLQLLTAVIKCCAWNVESSQHVEDFILIMVYLFKSCGIFSTNLSKLIYKLHKENISNSQNLQQTNKHTQKYEYPAL
jgi:hypothetical protein